MIILPEAKNYPVGKVQNQLQYILNCFRGVDPQGEKIIQFTENKLSVNVKVAEMEIFKK